jgi:hypothetical protein
MLDLPDNALKKGFRNPAEAAGFLIKKRDKIYKIPYLTSRTINQYYYEKFKQPGELDIMNENWDTLLIVDACRYDYYRKIA